jgi:hypothetical protein
LISKELKRVSRVEDIHKSMAYKKRLDWLIKVTGNKDAENLNIGKLHQQMLKLDQETVVKAFREHTAAFPR